MSMEIDGELDSILRITLSFKPGLSQIAGVITECSNIKKPVSG